QLMHNMLQHNNRNGTFSDVAWQGGVARTDWSWAALIADFDLDGNKDIFVANGLARDVTQQDYLTFLASDQTMLAATRGKHVDFLSLINAMSSTKLPDYAFRNNGDLTFTNASAAWGVSRPSFSNGAAYGDLDGDGAPDLVVNNVNDEAFVYRNNARTQLPQNHYLQVSLVGDSANRFAVGARVTLRSKNREFVQELEPTRGFQSSVDYTLTFGVGAIDMLDSVVVEWPDGHVSSMSRVATNRRVTIRRAAGSGAGPRTTHHAPRTLFTDVTSTVGLDFVDHENDFVDFDREPLIPKMVSREGPLVAVCDVNGDGLDDFFIGGARDQPSALYLQRANGTFTATNQALFATDSISEDLGAAFVDANGDGHLDLYVVTGGNEYSILAPALEDRLYLGDGRGNFNKTAGRLPSLPNSGSRVAISKDYVFVGGRVVPGRYGVDPPSTLLRNGGGGRGNFTDVTAQVAPDLAQVGMVTDALWIDVDGDNRLDLVVVGEWMPITIFHNTGTRLARVTTKGLEHSTGWWNRIITGDFNGDGRPDFVVGNLGLNSRLHASAAEPARMYVKDLDRSGFFDQIVTLYERATLDAPQAVSLPLSLRDELTAAMPSLKPRYPKYSDYAGQTVEQIFGKGLDGAVVKQAETFATAIALSNRDGSYTLVALPREAQIAPVYGILASDFDHDGKLDLLLAGNFEGVQPEIGSMMASYGLMLRGDGRGRFTPLRAGESGFFVPGEARDIERLRTRRGDLYIIARNNDRPLFFRPLR
ncbi:MAG TPA: VCBS repeat-containing protein, partial [Gemmatimonadales bacterium]